MDDRQLGQFRSRLAEQRATDEALLEEIDVRPTDATAHTMESGEAGGVHQAKATRQQDEQANRREAARQRLAQIEQALARMEDGTYGTCEVCDADIDPDRLDALPMTTRCREHAPTEERAG